MQKLVIVESPTKAPTIKGYLGSGYKVVASKGHVRDLPKSTLGIDIDNNFEAHYINIRGKGDVIKELKEIDEDLVEELTKPILMKNKLVFETSEGCWSWKPQDSLL